MDYVAMEVVWKAVRKAVRKAMVEVVLVENRKVVDERDCAS